MDVKDFLKRNSDLIGFGSLAALIDVLVLNDSSNSQFYLAAILFFFGLGYCLSFVLWPKEHPLIHRIGVGLLASPIITAVLSVIIEASATLTMAISSAVIVIVSIALLRKKASADGEASEAISLLSRAWDRYYQMGGKKRIVWLASLTIVIMLIWTAWSIALTPPASDPFTDFYILDESRSIDNLPFNVTAGENNTVIIGLANHEGRAVFYFVQVWLVESRTVNDHTSVISAYYVDYFSRRLLNSELESGTDYSSQWETKYTFNLNVTGTYKLWFFLSKDNQPALDMNLTKMQNYPGDYIEDLVNDARLFEIQSLNLNVVIRTE
jgi:uncharacterized membrane protein